MIRDDFRLALDILGQAARNDDNGRTFAASRSVRRAPIG
jgi:hypothetical protein